MMEKIRGAHRERSAVIYLRQSTLKQVLQHRESTARQYNLQNRAAELGWPAERIEVIDQDLGQSGSSAEWRLGFQRLAENVARGRVGAIFALEVSRLARSSADWHRLLELCGLADVVIVDEQAVYEPRDYNDRLLLGLKGTMSEAEQYWMRLRLDGGRLSKARRGEYSFASPTGYLWDPSTSRFRFDPDEQVQRAVRLVFERFRLDGRAYAVARYFAEHELLIPTRNRAGVLSWVAPKPAIILRMLHNPAYAGAYVFGRSEERMALVDGQIRRRHKTSLPQEKWKVCIPDRHPAYIGWEEFMSNRRKLRENRTHGDSPCPRGATREGAALLQGLALCGRCGRRMMTQYRGGERQAQYLCRSGNLPGGTVCSIVSARAIDDTVARVFLGAVQPPEIELSLAVTREAERQSGEIDQQWKLRLDRVRYEARLAERRYKAVDPDHRVIARTLEREWEEKLREIESLEREHEEARRRQRLSLNDADRARIRSLSKDLSRVWDAPTTTHADRKNLLRMLICEVALNPIAGPLRRTKVRIQWDTGAVTELTVEQRNPLGMIATSAEAIAVIKSMISRNTDREIADALNRRGIRTGSHRPWSVRSVRWARSHHGILRRAVGAKSSHHKRLEDGLHTVAEVALRFDISEATVYSWIRNGSIRAVEGGGKGHAWRLKLDGKTEAQLRSLATRAHGNRRRR